MQDDYDGSLVPACGGAERPFTVAGRRWLYCWHRQSSRHCYLNLDTDIAVWHRSFHPAFAPEFEHVPDSDPVPLACSVP